MSNNALDSVQHAVPADASNVQSFAVQTAAAGLASNTSRWVMERFDDAIWKEKIRTAACCARLAGCFDLSCKRCKSVVTEGKYARESHLESSHVFASLTFGGSDCCECDDDYDLCLSCYQSGTKCPVSTHILTVRQLAVYGDVCNPDKFQALELQECKEDMWCDRCNASILQGRFYSMLLFPSALGHLTSPIAGCIACNKHDGGFDLCVNCYHEGQLCNQPNSHRLYTFLRAFYPGNIGTYTYLGGEGSASCNRCGKEIYQGAYYRRRFHNPKYWDFTRQSETNVMKDCDQCLTGNFDLCHSCYELGESCQNSGHLLKLHFAYSTLVSQSTIYEHGIAIDCNICNMPVRGTHGYRKHRSPTHSRGSMLIMRPF